MATTLACSLSVSIRASSRSGSSSSKKPESNRNKPVSPSSWWAPIFGWSSDADYIDNGTANRISFESNKSTATDRIGELQLAQPRSRFVLGSFTEEKAKQLRRKTLESSAFHDRMYHSAIASRLATDTSENGDF